MTKEDKREKKPHIRTLRQPQEGEAVGQSPTPAPKRRGRKHLRDLIAAAQKDADWYYEAHIEHIKREAKNPTPPGPTHWRWRSWRWDWGKDAVKHQEKADALRAEFRKLFGEEP